MISRLIVTGYGRHGKDTACEYIRDSFGLTFASSSEMANQLFLFDQLRDKFGYSTPEECYADRHNHRELWYNAIRQYNEPDLCRLGRQLFMEHDVYCGIRNDEEFNALKEARLFDVAIWIDASERRGPESTKSMSLTREDADLVITNNGTKEEFHETLERSISELLQRQPVPRMKVA